MQWAINLVIAGSHIHLHQGFVWVHIDEHISLNIFYCSVQMDQAWQESTEAFSIVMLTNIYFITVENDYCLWVQLTCDDTKNHRNKMSADYSALCLPETRTHTVLQTQEEIQTLTMCMDDTRYRSHISFMIIWSNYLLPCSQTSVQQSHYPTQDLVRMTIHPDIVITNCIVAHFSYPLSINP